MSPATPAVAPKGQPPRKRQPATIPDAAITVTAPAVPADQVFCNVVNAQRDSAMVLEQALRSQLAAREGQYERDLARLCAEYAIDVGSLNEQIGQQVAVIGAADAALESLQGDKVVQLRQPVEVAA